MGGIFSTQHRRWTPPPQHHTHTQHGHEKSLLREVETASQSSAPRAEPLSAGHRGQVQFQKINYFLAVLSSCPSANVTPSQSAEIGERERLGQMRSSCAERARRLLRHRSAQGSTGRRTLSGRQTCSAPHPSDPARWRTCGLQHDSRRRERGRMSEQCAVWRRLGVCGKPTLGGTPQRRSNTAGFLRGGVGVSAGPGKLQTRTTGPFPRPKQLQSQVEPTRALPAAGLESEEVKVPQRLARAKLGVLHERDHLCLGRRRLPRPRTDRGTPHKPAWGRPRGVSSELRRWRGGGSRTVYLEPAFLDRNEQLPDDAGASAGLPSRPRMDGRPPGMT